MRIFVAGGTGTVGGALLPRLAGHDLTVLSRRARPELPHRVVVADALRDPLEAVVRGSEVVISALGASVGPSLSARAGFGQVDVPANLALLEAAVAAGVERFVYVGSHAGPGYAHTVYVDAHEQVTRALHDAPIEVTVVRPVGLFPSLEPFMDMARAGVAFVPGDGTSRTNPVHPDDVVDCIVRHLEAGPAEVAIGGPDVFTRREIAELPFQVLGKRARVISVPPSGPSAAARLLRPLHPRLGELMAFAVAVSTSDAVAPALGTRRLRAFFEGLAATHG